MSSKINQPEVIDTGGTLPVFWDHNVLFIANLLALFFGNEAGTKLLAKEVRGAETYGGRLVPILNLLYRGQGNRLILERQPDPSLLRYFRDDLQLDIPETQILSHESYVRLGEALKSGDTPRMLESLKALPLEGIDSLDGYVTDETLMRIADQLDLPTVSTMEGSRRGNNKFLLHEALSQAGFPIFETAMAAAPQDVPKCLRQLEQMGFDKAAVKSQLGASGIGMIRLPVKADKAQLQAIDELMFYEGPCLVQGWMEAGRDGVSELTSPSVQVFLGASTVQLYDVTEQILSDESVHQGNESPPAYLKEDSALRNELFRQAGFAGTWLHNQGYRGTASVDFIVAHRKGESPVVYVCEINARVTGATYPSVLARNFMPKGAWIMRNLRMKQPLTGEELIRKLAERDSLFRPGAGAGILPINFNTEDNGNVHKGQFLCLGETLEACREFLQSSETALDHPWHYERD